MSPKDLDRYLDRIGYRGERAATLDVLRALQRLHVATFPFEDLDPLLGRPVELSHEALVAKMVGRRRGGYCFEQNLLFQRVLEALGFEVRGLLGRAGLGAEPVGRTHMILLVTLEDHRYVVDVGYGGNVPSAPLRFTLDVPQETPHGYYRVVAAEHDEYRVEAEVDERWRRLYEFDLRRQLFADFEVANWYTSTSPRTLFTQTLVAARAAQGVRYALRGRTLAIHRVGGPSEHRELATPQALAEALRSELHIDVESDAHAEALFERALPIAPITPSPPRR